MGLIVFAGEPKVQLPITSDYRMARAFARRIDPSLVPVQGTAVGKALEQALLAFSGETEAGTAASWCSSPTARTTRTTPWPWPNAPPGRASASTPSASARPKARRSRSTANSSRTSRARWSSRKLNEEMLSKIAETTGGAYVRATKQDIGLDEIVREINDMERSELSTVRFEEFNEQYQYLLLAALVLLLAEFLVLDRRNPLLAHLNIFREPERKEPGL